MRTYKKSRFRGGASKGSQSFKGWGNPWRTSESLVLTHYTTPDGSLLLYSTLCNLSISFADFLLMQKVHKCSHVREVWTAVWLGARRPMGRCYCERRTAILTCCISSEWREVCHGILTAARHSVAQHTGHARFSKTNTLSLSKSLPQSLV